MTSAVKKVQKPEEDEDMKELDRLLNSLSPEELEVLETELIDPDDPHVPPGDRCKYRCKKEPTGPFNRKALLEFLEDKAKNEKDWEEVKPYVKEIRGKVWKRKDDEKLKLHDDETIETEWDEILANATEEDLVDLAAILGFYGMLNQVQYHDAFVEKKEKVEGESGFQSVAKHQPLKTYPDEPPNTTDVDASLDKLKSNDKELKDLNLNNIKNIPLEKLAALGAALKTNTVLEHLSLANTRATEMVAREIAEGLRENKTLQSLNVESNYISGNGIIALLEAINVNQTITELRVANQRPQILGHKVEAKIAELVRQNQGLLKFGIFLETPGARVLVQEHLKKNNDKGRKDRMGFEDQPPPTKAATTKAKAPEKKEEPKKEEPKTAPPKEEPKKAPPKKEEESEESSSEEEDE